MCLVLLFPHCHCKMLIHNLCNGFISFQVTALVLVCCWFCSCYTVRLHSGKWVVQLSNCETEILWVSTASLLYIFICAPGCLYSHNFTGQQNRLWLLRKLYLYCLHSFMFLSKSLDKNAAVVTLSGVEKIILEELTSQILGSGNVVS